MNMQIPHATVRITHTSIVMMIFSVHVGLRGSEDVKDQLLAVTRCYTRSCSWIRKPVWPEALIYSSKRQ